MSFLLVLRAREFERKALLVELAGNSECCLSRFLVLVFFVLFSIGRVETEIWFHAFCNSEYFQVFQASNLDWFARPLLFTNSLLIISQSPEMNMINHETIISLFSFSKWSSL